VKNWAMRYSFTINVFQFFLAKIFKKNRSEKGWSSNIIQKNKVEFLKTHDF